MRPRGPGSRFAYDPTVVAAFIDAHTTMVADGFPRRERRVLNGRHLDADAARIVRRWRSGALTAASEKGVGRLLGAHGLTTYDFTQWAQGEGFEPVLRSNR